MDTDGWKIHSQSAVELNATLGGFDELWDVAMTWVEPRVGVDDTDDGSGEGILTVTEGFDEDLAKEEGEMRVAIRCEVLAKARGRGEGCREVVVWVR